MEDDMVEDRYDCWLYKYGDPRGARLFRQITKEEEKSLISEGWCDRPLPPDEVRKRKGGRKGGKKGDKE